MVLPKLLVLEEEREMLALPLLLLCSFTLLKTLARRTILLTHILMAS